MVVMPAAVADGAKFFISDFGDVGTEFGGVGIAFGGKAVAEPDTAALLTARFC